MYLYCLVLLSLFLRNVASATSLEEDENLRGRFPAGSLFPAPLTGLPQAPSVLTAAAPPPNNSSSASACAALRKSLAEKFETNPIENIYMRPTSSSSATLVKIAIDVKNIPWIQEDKSQWKMMLDIFQFWSDTRLAYSTKACPQIKRISLPKSDTIWKPDLFFPLSEGGFVHVVPQTNFLLWVTPNGDVTYGTRLTLTMDCTGKGSLAGELLCPLIISSYKSPKEKLKIQWVKENPVQVDWDRLTLKDYRVENVTTLETEHSIRLGTYSYAVANFRFGKNQCSATIEPTSFLWPCQARPGQSY